MNRDRQFFPPLVLLIFLCLMPLWVSGQNSQAPTTSFLRFLPGAGEFAGELQTVIATYRNDSGIEVDLVAAVHMADRAYYEDLNDYFATRDAVLYELVADEDARPDGTQPASVTGLIGFLQTSMTRLLGLSYQLNVVDYTPPNFIHADLEPQELEAVMEAKGETLFSSFLNLALQEMTRQQQALKDGTGTPLELTVTDLIRVFSLPNRQEALKYLLGQSLATAGDGLLGLGSGTGITILDDRNEAALDALDTSLAEQRWTTFSIFYGAAHMGGLELGLEERGFTRVKQTWLTAWATGAPQPTASDTGF